MACTRSTSAARLSVKDGFTARQMSFETASVACRDEANQRTYGKVLFLPVGRRTLYVRLIAERLRLLPDHISKGVIRADAECILPAATIGNALQYCRPLWYRSMHKLAPVYDIEEVRNTHNASWKTRDA